MSGKTPTRRIEDAIGDAAVAQEMINLAQEEGANLEDVAALLEKKVDANQIKVWFQNGPTLNGAAALLDQGIDASVVTQLIENTADLRVIATNAQNLFNEGVRVDLVNVWLKNGTHLKDAIAIINQGVDLNLIGTSRKVGDFTGLTGATPNEVVARIPESAEIEHWTLVLGGARDGMKFKWQDTSGKNWRLEMHSPDPNPKLPAWSNAARGWVLRIKRRSEYMSGTGTFDKDSIENPRSPNYNLTAINDTHIPIQAP